MTDQTDQEFLDTFITERLQMHYSKEHPGLTGDELAAALQLESDYNDALEGLSPDAAAAIKKFHDHIADKLTAENVFYYLKGVKDGLLLYKTLENL